MKDKLIDQRARNDLVVMLLEAEMEEVTETRTVLATVTAHLQNMVTNGRQRLVSNHHQSHPLPQCPESV